MTALDRAKYQDKAKEIFEQLKLRMSVLSEQKMRREIFGETLLTLPLEVQVELLHLIAQESAHDSKATPLLVALQDQPDATHALTYQQVRDIYGQAHHYGYSQVQRLLLASNTPTESSATKGHPALSGTPLGMRKYLARHPNPTMLEKLLLDPDPTVIHNLLRNPRITEREVLRICSRRPNRPEVLSEVANHPRWINRYRVKLAITQNPDAPPSVTLQILPQLLTSHLERIAQMKNLPPQVTFMTEEILALRHKQQNQNSTPLEEDPGQTEELASSAEIDTSEPG